LLQLFYDAAIMSLQIKISSACQLRRIFLFASKLQFMNTSDANSNIN